MINWLLQPLVQIVDKNGNPVVGAKVYVYYSNPETLATIYSDDAGTVQENPVLTDTLGNVTIFADTEYLYDVIVYDPNGNLLFGKKHIAPASLLDVSSNEVKVEAGEGISVTKTVSEGQITYTVSCDFDVVALEETVAQKQDRLEAGQNIEITNQNIINVTGRKSFDVHSPLIKEITDTKVVIGVDGNELKDYIVSGGLLTGAYVPWSATNLPIGAECQATNIAGAIGSENTANNFSYVFGRNSQAYENSFAAGIQSYASGDSLSFGNGNRSEQNSLSHGFANTAYSNSISQGYMSLASSYGFSQGSQDKAIGESLAQGVRNSATDFSLAQGNYNSAGSASFAQGDHCYASVTSFAQGNSNSATNNTVVFGHDNNGDNNSFIHGFENSAYFQSQILGFRNSAYSNSTVIGFDNRANRARIIGFSNTGIDTKIYGDNCSATNSLFVAGNSNTATVNQSFAIGAGLSVNTTKAAMGRYNIDRPDTEFCYGIGSANDYRLNAFEIKNDGTFVTNDLEAQSVKFDGILNYRPIIVDYRNGGVQIDSASQTKNLSLNILDVRKGGTVFMNLYIPTIHMNYMETVQSNSYIQMSIENEDDEIIWRNRIKLTDLNQAIQMSFIFQNNTTSIKHLYLKLSSDLYFQENVNDRLVYMNGGYIFG